MRYAAIDVGTNTTRLVVVEDAASNLRDLERRLSFTRLGEGTDATGLLRPEAIERTVRVIAEYCAVAGELSVERLRIAGTSAVRDAGNADELLDAVRKVSGSPLEILEGEEEARLSFLGATADLSESRCLVCDIGGGSTEFVCGVPGGKIEGRISLDIGSVRLTERFLVSNPPATEEILMMEGTIDRCLERVDEVMPDLEGVSFVGVAGTVTSIASLHLGQTEYDPRATHHLRLDRTSVNMHYRHLADLTVERREKLESLPPGRADIIVAGISILARSMAHWGFQQVLVSEKDILDGLVLDML